MFRTYEHVLEENIKMWGIIHVHKFLINMWEYNLWECNLWQRVPSQIKVQYCKITYKLFLVKVLAIFYCRHAEECVLSLISDRPNVIQNVSNVQILYF